MRRNVPREYEPSPVRCCLYQNPMDDAIHIGTSAFTTVEDRRRREPSPLLPRHWIHHPQLLPIERSVACGGTSLVDGTCGNLYGAYGRVQVVPASAEEQQLACAGRQQKAVEVFVENLSTPDEFKHVSKAAIGNSSNNKEIGSAGGPRCSHFVWKGHDCSTSCSINAERSYSSSSTQASTSDAYPKSPTMSHTEIARMCQGANDSEEEYILSPFDSSACMESGRAPPSDMFFSALIDPPSEYALRSQIDKVGQAASCTSGVTSGALTKPSSCEPWHAHAELEGGSEDYILSPFTNDQGSSVTMAGSSTYGAAYVDKNCKDGVEVPLPVSIGHALQRLRESLAKPSAVEYSTAEDS